MKRSNNRLQRSIQVALIFIPVVICLMIPAFKIIWRENHVLPFDRSGFEKVVDEFESGDFRVQKNGRIQLLGSESNLTNDGCIYITTDDHMRLMVFFPTRPYNWSSPPCHFYDGYLYCSGSTAFLDGQTVEINRPPQTPTECLFVIEKHEAPNWYRLGAFD